MDKETLSNYGWIVICVLVLAVMIALATPFGTFISEAVQNTIGSLFDTHENALNAVDITMNPTYVAEGAQYITVDGKEYNAGERMPAEVQTGDRYICGDYEYRYNCYYYGYEGRWYEDIPLNGWGTTVRDRNKSSYEALLTEINRAPVTGLSYAFYNCLSLEVAPTIPDSITSLGATFTDCRALKSIPNIPEGVINMTKTFQGCVSLTSVPTIPNSVTKMANCFNGCQALTGTITINANPGAYGFCFKNVDFASQNITLVGTSELLSELGATGLNY